MTDIHIPPDALHAAYAEWWRVIKSSSKKGSALEAAIRAALAAWPGVQHRVLIEHAIILPLNTENPDVSHGENR